MAVVEAEATVVAVEVEAVATEVVATEEVAAAAAAAGTATQASLETIALVARAHLTISHSLLSMVAEEGLLTEWGRRTSRWATASITPWSDC